MEANILQRLHTIEFEEQVRILYACESGSRAWGFPSADSDYDVRFLYLHPRSWYLSVDLEQKRDVIERPVDGSLDVSGWDLRKALGLMRHGNPPLMEWLGSPVVYCDRFGVADLMRDLKSRFYLPATAAHHYLRMARQHHDGYGQRPAASIKSTFYALRALLAIRWIERGLGAVPTEFQTLVQEVVDSAPLRHEIEVLVESKGRGKEQDRDPPVAIISDFIDAELSRLAGRPFKHLSGTAPAPAEEFNRVFRAALAALEQAMLEGA